MQCWRCKQYGHRTGDRECPLFMTGNIEQDARRQVRVSWDAIAAAHPLARFLFK